MAPRTDAIRSYEAPLGLLKHAAAQYLSLPIHRFDELVRSKLLPRPKLVAGREIWDREELRLHFKSLPDNAEDQVSVDNTWDD